MGGTDIQPNAMHTLLCTTRQPPATTTRINECTRYIRRHLHPKYNNGDWRRWYLRISRSSEHDITRLINQGVLVWSSRRKSIALITLARTGESAVCIWHQLWDTIHWCVNARRNTRGFNCSVAWNSFLKCSIFDVPSRNVDSNQAPNEIAVSCSSILQQSNLVVWPACN